MELGNEASLFRDDSLLSMIEELSYPVVWESRASFYVEDRKITKLHDDTYWSLCSKNPLQGFSTFKVKFRVCRLGTFAIGIVPEENKSGRFIDDRKSNVLKYLAFANGDGGKLIINKQELASGKQLGLAQGD